MHLRLMTVTVLLALSVIDSQSYRMEIGISKSVVR